MRQQVSFRALVAAKLKRAGLLALRADIHLALPEPNKALNEQNRADKNPHDLSKPDIKAVINPTKMKMIGKRQ